MRAIILTEEVRAAVRTATVEHGGDTRELRLRSVRPSMLRAAAVTFTVAIEGVEMRASADVDDADISNPSVIIEAIQRAARAVLEREGY